MTKQNRRLAVVIAAAAFCSLFAVVAAAQQFPRVQEENLAGQQIAVPDAASGRIAVLVLGFSHASSTPSGAWAKRIRSDFGKAPGFELYQLAVLEGAPKMFRGMIISSIKKGVPENERANFIPVLHNAEQLQKLVGFKAEDDAYIVVLDRSGTVAYQTHSASVDPGYSELRAKVQSLLK
jgi:hypothetical protein